MAADTLMHVLISLCCDFSLCLAVEVSPGQVFLLWVQGHFL